MSKLLKIFIASVSLMISTNCDESDDVEIIDPLFQWSQIPAGEFLSGQYGLPLTIDHDYYIMLNEVSNREYSNYLNDALADSALYSVDSISVSGLYTGDIKWGAGVYEYLDLDDPDCKIVWNNEIFEVLSGYEDYPVVEVTWIGAWAMADYYNYSLPTHEEWEKAARGTSGWEFPWGDDSPTCEKANFAGCNTGLVELSSTSGTSPFGLFNMAGNAKEWVNTFSDEFDFKRIYCGGGWNSYPESIKSWKTESDIPEVSKYDIGFRLVRNFEE